MAQPTRRYTISRAAVADLESIYAYGAKQWGVDQAERYQDQIFAACEAIASGKRRGRPLLDDFLKLTVGSHFVIFREGEATVYITRVLHQRMDVARHLKR